MPSSPALSHHALHWSALPPWMGAPFAASIGLALLTSAIALASVLRSDPAPATTPPLASSPDEQSTPVPPNPPAPLQSVPAAPVTVTVPTEEAGTVQWPDLGVDDLPPMDSAPQTMGQSIGSPRDGALLHARPLPSSPDYVIRNTSTAWGTDNTINLLSTIVGQVRLENPQLPRLVIGDISTRRGGPLDGHTSHQAGRDVDIGLFYRRGSIPSPIHFIEATREILDRRGTFELIAALAATRHDPAGVKLIVLDYNLQRLLRNSAASRGVSEEELDAIFQFPRGAGSRHGLVRHRPAHRDHMHVRFGCPAYDTYCRDPLIGFGGMEASGAVDAQGYSTPPLPSSPGASSPEDAWSSPKSSSP